MSCRRPQLSGSRKFSGPLGAGRLCTPVTGVNVALHRPCYPPALRWSGHPGLSVNLAHQCHKPLGADTILSLSRFCFKQIRLSR